MSILVQAYDRARRIVKGSFEEISELSEKRRNLTL
jgi:hypothetical protein